MDFSADQEFIEGVIAYLNGLPLEDFYQDRQWQLKIDAMQGGSMAPIGAAEDLIVRQKKSNEHVFAWLAAKEAKEFELLRGQSSMWFYLEEFYLSDVFINVTLALSSSFNTSGSAYSSTSEPGREDDRQRSMLRGFLSRVSGSDGFQLINVTNAPIQLEYVELKNHLVNRVSLINKLYRHYSWIALAQARKVLGGAGPAIAAIPASLLWASIALVDLGQDVAAKRVNPLVMPTRIGYVVFTVMGQAQDGKETSRCLAFLWDLSRRQWDSGSGLQPGRSRRLARSCRVLDWHAWASAAFKESSFGGFKRLGWPSRTSCRLRVQVPHRQPCKGP
ncbi:hypothetical protein Vretifemale_2372 [Volvox reticuliferus]|nr:hypothetical protein Vretifemale_2372 [Volvox reticuliferus]